MRGPLAPPTRPPSPITALLLRAATIPELRIREAEVRVPRLIAFDGVLLVPEGHGRVYEATIAGLRERPREV